MDTMASQITSLTIIYSTIYLVTDQRKHQSSASLAFVRGIPGEFLAQMASNTENVSIWWRHHVYVCPVPCYYTSKWGLMEIQSEEQYHENMIIMQNIHSSGVFWIPLNVIKRNWCHSEMLPTSKIAVMYKNIIHSLGNDPYYWRYMDRMCMTHTYMNNITLFVCDTEARFIVLAGAFDI